MKIITIPQIDNVTRYIALDDEDAEIVRRDPARIDGIGALAILDVERHSDSCDDWYAPADLTYSFAKRGDSAHVRNLLRRAARGE